MEQACIYHAHHHMRSGKFDEGILCDLLVIAYGWVITLHVSATPQCQDLFANNPNTSEPQRVRDRCLLHGGTGPHITPYAVKQNQGM